MATKAQLEKRKQRYATEPEFAEQRRADPVIHQKELEAKRRRRLGAEREVVVERYLVEQVKLLGGFCPKFIDPGHRGAPDRLVLLRGHPTYFVELKRPTGGVVEHAQRVYHMRIEVAGQRVFILKSRDEVDAFLDGLSLT